MSRVIANKLKENGSLMGPRPGAAAWAVSYTPIIEHTQDVHCGSGSGGASKSPGWAARLAEFEAPMFDEIVSAPSA